MITLDMGAQPILEGVARRTTPMITDFKSARAEAQAKIREHELAIQTLKTLFG